MRKGRLVSSIIFFVLVFKLYSQNQRVKFFFDKSGKSVSLKDAYYYRQDSDTADFYRAFYVSNNILFYQGKLLTANNEDDSKSVFIGNISWFHKNGNKKQMRSFNENGVEHGTSKYYFESGSLWKEMEFINGVLKNNVYTEYEENGLMNRIFEDEFIDNRNDWDLYQSDKSIASIKDGFFEISSLQQEGTSRFINFPVNSSSYAFEAIVHFPLLKNQKDSDRLGLLYGFKDWQNYHYFVISKKNIYIGSVFEGINSVRVDGVYCPDIKPAEKNNLKVISNGEKIYYSVNGQIQHSGKVDKLYRSNFGFVLSGKASMRVDRLSIKEIDGSDKNAPGSPSDVNVKATGSGILVSTGGYIVTNHHVVDNASKFIIEVNSPTGKMSYKAELIQVDKDNDLAILKINDENFKALEALKYAFKESGGVEVGSAVFTIGYPYALAGMGKEAKFTDGKISAKTGYNGALNSFQSTIPVQPGNSGGPVFNDKGQLVGIINSSIRQADNVSYAIKLNYVNNLIDLLSDSPQRPNDNYISNLSLEEKIKVLTDYVVLIKVK